MSLKPRFHIYILFSEEFERFYVGQTQDLEARIIRHNKGYVRSTKNYRPWMLVWSMDVDRRSDSMKIEARIKSWKSSEIIKRLIYHQIKIENC